MNSRTLGTNITNIKFKNNHIVYENFVKCTIKDYEFNLSYNPTLLSGSQTLLMPYSSSVGGDIFYIITGSEYYGTLKDFATGSISGSEFSPYLSTVGLYNDAGDLLAIAKMAAPMPISSNNDMTFLVKWDTQWTPNNYVAPSPTPSRSLPPTPSVTPSISRTPSVTPSITVSRSIPATPSVTPTATPSVTVSPSIGASPTVTPTSTPSITITPSVTVTRTPTPTPTPSRTLYSINLYAKLEGSVSGGNTPPYIQYSTDNTNWEDFEMSGISTTSCAFKNTITSVSSGTTMYFRVVDTVQQEVFFNYSVVNTSVGGDCPALGASTCSFNTVINNNKNIYFTVTVSGGNLISC